LWRLGESARQSLFGVTFKPNTDDMRIHPSLTIVPSLVGKWCQGALWLIARFNAEGEALLPGGLDGGRL